MYIHVCTHVHVAELDLDIKLDVHVSHASLTELTQNEDTMLSISMWTMMTRS